jgi:hypothetical protein
LGRYAGVAAPEAPVIEVMAEATESNEPSDDDEPEVVWQTGEAA